MTELNQSITYDVVNSELAIQQIGLTASELHGLISGIICGGNQDPSWLALIHDFANNGLAFSGRLSDYVQQMYQNTTHQLENEDFSFQLFMPNDDSHLFGRIDELAGWVNHFLLGLGLMQPKLDKIGGEIGDVINDLRSIALLGYDEDEDKEELERSFEEVLEYVRMSATLCFSELAVTRQDHAPAVLH